MHIGGYPSRLRIFQATRVPARKVGQTLYDELHA